RYSGRVNNVSRPVSWAASVFLGRLRLTPAIKLDDGSRLVDADPLFAMPWSAYEPRVSL
ncbi:unnamed protein product, partial [Phaeothamnion confervicola]